MSWPQERGSLMQSLVEQNPGLTDADRAALDAQACRGLLWILAAQSAMALAAAAIAGIIAGTAAGLSALAGAGAYFIPNALFALRLLINVRKSGLASPDRKSTRRNSRHSSADRMRHSPWNKKNAKMND